MEAKASTGQILGPGLPARGSLRLQPSDFGRKGFVMSVFKRHRVGISAGWRTFPVRRAVTLILASLFSIAIGAAQDFNEGGSQATGEITKGQVIDLLRENPDALESVRRAMLESAKARGVADPQLTPTDVLRAVDEDERALQAAREEIQKRRLRPRIRVDREGVVTDVPRLPGPYQNLESLRDLYRQVPPTDTKLERFGASLFRKDVIGLTDPELSVGPDYIVGPGDTLAIEIWGTTSQRAVKVVDREGRVALPESGVVYVAGLTIDKVQAAIQTAVTRQLKGVKVDVALAKLRTVRIYIVGDVGRPGAYDVPAHVTPLYALITAGGPTSRGSLRLIRHFRESKLVAEVDLYDLMVRGMRAPLARVESGDTLLVPPAGPQVGVAGMVKRPGLYEIRGEQNLGEVFELAGGVSIAGALGDIQIDRIEPHQGRTTVSVRLESDATQESISKALAEFRVRDGDQITVAGLRPHSRGTVYLSGHVGRGGKFQFRDGMTVRDVIRGYADLLPEPAERAEIVRLVGEDNKPSVMQFNLVEELAGRQQTPLQPYDTIRVFGRYEADSPNVQIHGEVLRPGEYPMSEGMMASDLVRLAGGFKRSAALELADLTSYSEVQGKIIAESRTVPISRALNREPDADARLKPGDVLSIRQKTGWNDIGAAVTLAGEVTHPGTFGIEQGEKLSSVLRRAGGFRETAYAPGAILERVQIREAAVRTRDELIRKVRSEAAILNVGSDVSGDERKAEIESFHRQSAEVVEQLMAAPASGRLVVAISEDIATWENTPADLEVRAGDVITVPKRPEFVLVSGQVFNQTAIAFAPGKTAGWYLNQAGGATKNADRDGIFLIKANGRVIGGGRAFLGSGVLSAKVEPGDVVVVPAKVVRGTSAWRQLLQMAQVTSSLALAARVAAGL